MKQGDDLTFWEIQKLLAIFAASGVFWGGITWLIQLWAGGPWWLPYTVGLAFFVAGLGIVQLNHKYGHRH